VTVSHYLPNVTVLIAARPGQDVIHAVPASRALDYPADKLQILVARGRQPSAQRNVGLKAAKGELIYFLDDDSVPGPENLQMVVPYFQRAEVKVVGGPSVCPREAPVLEKVFALVLGSWLAFGPSRARYIPVGEVRETSEKELILCNMVARREALLELGGFNEALYPNEENALMDELQKLGSKLIYDPRFAVARRPRSNLKSFARMLMTYGRGRAEQFRLHPTLGSALNFVPPLFLLYLVLAFATLVGAPHLGRIILAPLELYGFAVLAQVVVLAVRSPVVQCAAAVPMIVLTHVLYGLGFWRGLFTQLKAPSDREPVPVDLESLDVGPQNPA
jgi:cellulose synthase/poly-beta-1,6-N-acetylglucosamine synthase-like glycosyltransferase